MTGGVLGPRVLLRLEGVAVLAGAAVWYWALGGSWWVFALGFLLPDLSLLGYLVTDRVGAGLYNLVHTYAGPVLLGALAALSASHVLGLAALIWGAHLGFDRLLGLGLKYPAGRRETHLHRV